MPDDMAAKPSVILVSFAEHLHAPANLEDLRLLVCVLGSYLLLICEKTT